MIEAVDKYHFVYLYDHLIKFGTQSETSRRIATDLSVKIATYVGELKISLGRDAKVWKKNALRHLWFPLLERLLPIVKDEVIAARVEPPPLPPRLMGHQFLFASTLDAYMDYMLGPCPRKTTPSLIRPTIQCDCDNCEDLNEFLQSPKQFSFSQGLSKERRDHISKKIKEGGIECKVETLERGNPKVFVVTKTAVAEDRTPAGQWMRSSTEIQQDILAWPQDDLRVLLGFEYQRVVAMENLYPPGRAPAIPKPKPPRVIHPIRRSTGSTSTYVSTTSAGSAASIAATSSRTFGNNGGRRKTDGRVRYIVRADSASSGTLTQRSNNAITRMPAPAPVPVPVVPQAMADAITARAESEYDQAMEDRSGFFFGAVLSSRSNKRRPVRQSVDLAELDAYYQTM